MLFRSATGALAVHESRAPYRARALAPALQAPKHKMASLCRRHHIKHLGVFGSAARGEAGANSDVDLLVEFKSGSSASLFDMVRMREEFSLLFGRKVDLVAASAIETPYRRSAILQDLRELYAA